jgi:hypothetical protein
MPVTRAAVARLLVWPSMRAPNGGRRRLVALAAASSRQGGRDGDDPSTIALPIARR